LGPTGIHSRPKCRSAESLILWDFFSLPERAVTPHLPRKSNKPNKQEFVNGPVRFCGNLANRFSKPFKFPGKAGEVVGFVVQIASHILECAAKGERDPTALKMAALLAVVECTHYSHDISPARSVV
jgi:hypothetical protein